VLPINGTPIVKATIGGILLAFALLRPLPAAADAVTDWNANAGKAAVAACLSPANDPLHESRLYAMMHVAVHDALNAIERRSRPYAFNVQGLPGTSRDGAVASAARHVLVAVIGQIPFPQAACIDPGIASVEADYAAALAGIPAGTAKTLGIQLGQAAAGAILALRAADGSDTALMDLAYPQGTAPGGYRFTPGFNFAFAPGWGDVAPFVLNDSFQFLPSPPYKVSSKKYAADFEEVKALGGDGITTLSARTPEQTDIGLFWIESSPLSWNRLARSVSAARALDLWENARSSACSTSPWPMGTSVRGRSSITTISGGPLRRFRRRTPTAIRTLRQTRPGHRFS
jgi:hypothetical protein